MPQGQFHFWIALIFETVKAGAIEQATRRFATAGSTMQNFLLSLVPSEIRQRRKDHLNFSREKVLRRLENTKTQRKDFIWYILDQQKRGAISQDEVIVNSALFIVAGSETTANLLSGLTARLIRNPGPYKKLCEEIRGAFRTEADIKFEELLKLPYLNACLEEGLRIHPPVPTGLLRTVPKGGATIDGHFVPEGTSVATGSWSAAHNPVNFSQPDEFIPERWLEPGWEEDKKKAAQPFSLGPRGCIGKQ